MTYGGCAQVVVGDGVPRMDAAIGQRPAGNRWDRWHSWAEMLNMAREQAS